MGKRKFGKVHQWGRSKKKRKKRTDLRGLLGDRVGGGIGREERGRPDQVAVVLC